jgi:hypothetical protein
MPLALVIQYPHAQLVSPHLWCTMFLTSQACSFLFLPSSQWVLVCDLPCFFQAHKHTPPLVGPLQYAKFPSSWKHSSLFLPSSQWVLICDFPCFWAHKCTPPFSSSPVSKPSMTCCISKLTSPLLPFPYLQLASSHLWLAVFSSSWMCFSLSEPSVTCHVSKLTSMLLPLLPFQPVSPHLWLVMFLSSWMPCSLFLPFSKWVPHLTCCVSKLINTFLSLSPLQSVSPLQCATFPSSPTHSFLFFPLASEFSFAMPCFWTYQPTSPSCSKLFPSPPFFSPLAGIFICDATLSNLPARFSLTINHFHRPSGCCY